MVTLLPLERVCRTSTARHSKQVPTSIFEHLLRKSRIRISCPSTYWRVGGDDTTWSLANHCLSCASQRRFPLRLRGWSRARRRRQAIMVIASDLLRVQPLGSKHFPFPRFTCETDSNDCHSIDTTASRIATSSIREVGATAIDLIVVRRRGKRIVSETRTRHRRAMFIPTNRSARLVRRWLPRRVWTSGCHGGRRVRRRAVYASGPRGCPSDGGAARRMEEPARLTRTSRSILLRRGETRGDDR